jgi:hypothetical protein
MLRMIILWMLAGNVACLAQQTVFNVPSADVLDAGKVYTELDAAYHPTHPDLDLVPRIVFGLGHRVEAGVNVNEFSYPNDYSTALHAVVKWKPYTGKHWSFFAGDHVVIPVYHRTYNLGNYVYAEFAYQFTHGPRVGMGAYHFSPQVVAPTEKAGGQFSVEQVVNGKLTLAADWYTGNHALGYLTPGLEYKLRPRITLYSGYEIGNHGLARGNHALLLEIGWNPN